jgi:hypothetical protein
VSARHFSLLAVGVALLVACGPGEAVDTTTTLTPSTTSTVGPTTTTTATTTTNGEVGLPDLVGDWDNGELFLQIADDGSYQVLESADADPDAPMIGGFLARDGADLNFVTNLFGECAGVTGVYSVELDEGRMVLTLVDDPCQYRATRFIEPWEPVP